MIMRLWRLTTSQSVYHLSHLHSSLSLPPACPLAVAADFFARSPASPALPRTQMSMMTTVPETTHLSDSSVESESPRTKRQLTEVAHFTNLIQESCSRAINMYESLGGEKEVMKKLIAYRTTTLNPGDAVDDEARTNLTSICRNHISYLDYELIQLGFPEFLPKKCTFDKLIDPTLDEQHVPMKTYHDKVLMNELGSFLNNKSSCSRPIFTCTTTDTRSLATARFFHSNANEICHSWNEHVGFVHGPIHLTPEQVMVAMSMVKPIDVETITSCGFHSEHSRHCEFQIQKSISVPQNAFSDLFVNSCMTGSGKTITTMTAIKLALLDPELKKLYKGMGEIKFNSPYALRGGFFSVPSEKKFGIHAVLMAVPKIIYQQTLRVARQILGDSVAIWENVCGRTLADAARLTEKGIPLFWLFEINQKKEVSHMLLNAHSRKYYFLFYFIDEISMSLTINNIDMAAKPLRTVWMTATASKISETCTSKPKAPLREACCEHNCQFEMKNTFTNAAVRNILPPEWLLLHANQSALAKMPSGFLVHQVTIKATNLTSSVFRNQTSGFSPVPLASNLRLLVPICQSTFSREKMDEFVEELNSNSPPSLDFIVDILFKMRQEIADPERFGRETFGNLNRTIKSMQVLIKKQNSTNETGQEEEEEEGLVCGITLEQIPLGRACVMSCCCNVIDKVVLPNLQACPYCRSSTSFTLNLDEVPEFMPPENIYKRDMSLSFQDGIAAIKNGNLTMIPAVTELLFLMLNNKPTARILLSYAFTNAGVDNNTSIVQGVFGEVRESFPSSKMFVVGQGRKKFDEESFNNKSHHPYPFLAVLDSSRGSAMVGGLDLHGVDYIIALHKETYSTNDASEHSLLQLLGRGTRMASVPRQPVKVFYLKNKK